MNDLERRLEEIEERLFELDSRLDKYDEIERLNIEKETIREMINMKNNAMYKYYVGLENVNTEEELEYHLFDDISSAEMRFTEIQEGLKMLQVSGLEGFWGMYDRVEDEYFCFAKCDANGRKDVE